MRPPRITFIALALVVVLGAAACGHGDVAADVKGSIITNAEVARLEPAIRMLVEARQGSCDPTAPPAQQGASPPPPEPKGSCDAFVLEQLIQARLVRQFAIDNKISVSATDVNDFMDQIQSFLEGQPSATGAKTSMNDVLAEKGVSLESLRELAQSLLLVGKVADYMGSHVSEDALKQAYEANLAQFTAFDTAHILVATEAEARKIKAEATTENFADLAKKYSTDKASAVKGGELGSVTASQFVAEYANAVMAAKPGQIIGPVQSQFGYHVIWVKKVDIKPFEQVKDQIKSSSTTSGEAMSGFMADQLKSGGVTVNPRYGRFDVETGRIVPVNSTAVSPGAGVPSP